MENQRLSGASKLVIALCAATTFLGFKLMGDCQKMYHQQERLNLQYASEIKQEYYDDKATSSSAMAALLPTVFAVYMVGATEAVRRKETN